MSYTIKLYKFNFADPSYNKVKWFTSKGARNEYFNSLAGTITLTNNGRALKNNTIDVPYAKNDLINYNYLSISMMQFCFITNIEYINENNSRVSYSLDPLITYINGDDYTIGTCMVEREHVTDDVIGRYTLDEGLPQGDLVKVNSFSYGEYNLIYCMHVTVDPEKPLKDNGEPNGVGSSYQTGLVYGGKIATYSDYGTFSNAVKRIVEAGLEDAILGIFQLPDTIIDGLDRIVNNRGTPVTSIQISATKTGALDGYTPRNKKLLTYPFIQIELSNNNGNIIPLRQERFSDNPMKFQVVGVVSSGTSQCCYPLNYNGYVEDHDDMLTLPPFPTSQWYTNPLAEYYNQNGVSIFTSLAKNTVTGAIAGAGTGAVAGGVGAVPGAIIGGLGGLAATGLSLWGQLEKENSLPSQSRGTMPSNAILSVAGANKFWVNIKTINHEKAVAYDDWFDEYGYKVNRRKVPNLTTRTGFNYVKVADFETSQNKVPATYYNMIQNAFMNGIKLIH